MQKKEFNNFRNKNLNIFKQIVEQSPNSIVITNLDGNIEYVNSMFTETTGYSLKEVINQNPRILNAGIQPREYYAEMWKTIKNGKTWQGEFYNKKKNGEIYLEAVKISPIKNKGGENTHYLGIKTDVTKLKENEERLKSFINIVPDIICYKDGQGRWLLANEADLKLFCLTEVDYFGKTDAELADFTSDIYKEAFLTCMITDEKAWKSKTISHVEETIPTIEGSERIYDVFKIPSFYPNGERKGLAVIGRDITELKRNEKMLLKLKQKAEESNLLKTEFINNMSHEIRTPLNGILGFSSLLNRPNLTDENRKYYTKIIQKSGNQLLRIIDDILEISRLGTKQEKIYEKKVCLNEIFSDLFSIFELKAKEKGLKLKIKTELSQKESTILTDETKLIKIISNLLGNALKFTNKGFIEFGYKLITDPKPAVIEIYVKDTGIGIKPENHKTIFKRFVQEEKQISKKAGGLGLGLSIVKENLELLGGKIRIESDKGKGATFFITIPYKPVNQESIKNSTENNSKKIVKTKNKYTVLIVEDEETNYLYINTFLNYYELNLTILHAKHGQEAVEICKKNQEIDLVLMDLKMPVMTGFEATKLIKKFRPNLKIIAQTAYSTKEEKEQAFAAGCDDFISKPISEEDLNRMIDKHLIIKQ